MEKSKDKKQIAKIIENINFYTLKDFQFLKLYRVWNQFLTRSKYIKV